MITVQITPNFRVKIADRLRDGRNITALAYKADADMPFQGKVNGMPVSWHANGMFFKNRRSSLDLRIVDADAGVLK